MTVWDVVQQPERERFAFWHEVLCQAFVPLLPGRLERETRFAGRVESRPLGPLVRARLESQRQTTAHGPRQVAQTEGADYFVNLQLQGRCRVRQRGGEHVTEAGRLSIVDTTEPYWFDQPEAWRIMSYRIPKDQLDARLGGLRVPVGEPLEGPAATVVRSLMTALWSADVDNPAAAGELAEAFCSGVAAAMIGTAGPEPSARAARRLAVLQHVRAHLGDPALSVTTTARALGLAPRTLHGLFADQPETFGHLVRRLRLERAAARLADPDGPSVTEVAASVGLPDPSAFSRAFRRHFGHAPSDARTAQRPGTH